MKNAFEELRGTIWYTLLMAISWLILIGALIGAGLLVRQVFYEPQAQSAYQFGVTQKLADWCASDPTDPFNAGTLAELKSDMLGKPDRFQKLSYGLRDQVENAVRGDRAGACGVGVK